MKRITCPLHRRQLLQDQQLNRARTIIRHRAKHSAGTIIIATRSIARRSPHPYKVQCAIDALASRKVAA